MALKGGDQAPKFVGAARPQVLDVCRDDVPQALIADVFEPCFQAGDVRFDLFDEGQLVAEPIQARIGRRCFLGIEHVRAGGDQHGIDAVAFGAAQVQPGEGADLQRLQDDDREAGRLQVPGDAPLVAAAGLDADPLHAFLAELGGEALPTCRRVVDRERITPAVDGDVEPVLAGIDPGRVRDSLDHLRLTPPCEIEPFVRATIRVR
jgi:hypothetical protein